MMKQKNLLHLWDYSSSQVINLIDLAIQEKQNLKRGIVNQPLTGKVGVLFFEKPSLRTKVTFEVAINQLGGNIVNLNPSEVSLGKRETVEDAAKNLSCWVNVIIARTFSQRLVEELAKYSSIPVINALSDRYHPCQALAFAQTLKEKRGGLRGASIVFAGDANNVSNSLAILCAKLGMDFTLASPNGFEPPDEFQIRLKHLANKNRCSYRIEPNFKIAVKTADLIYTDVWVSMGEEKLKEKKEKSFLNYQVNQDILSYAKNDCLVSHCLPAHRGKEITADVIDSKQSICFEEAENRLHIQKAVLLCLLS